MREYSFLFQHSKILIHNIFHLHSIFIAIQSGYPLNMSATLCSWFIFSYPFIINSLDCFRCYHYYRQQCENDQEITMMTKILQLVYSIQHYLGLGSIFTRDKIAKSLRPWLQQIKCIKQLSHIPICWLCLMIDVFLKSSWLLTFCWNCLQVLSTL